MNDFNYLISENNKRIRLSSENSSSDGNIQEFSKIVNSLEESQPAEDSFMVAQQNEEDNANTSSLALPIELICEIFLKLNDKNDLIKCFCLSKGMNKLMYRTPNFMRKIEYELNCVDDENFIKKRGKYIRRLNLTCFKDDRNCLLPSLRHTPNIEDLVLFSKRASRNYYIFGETASDFESGTDDGSVLSDSDHESDLEGYTMFRVNNYIKLPKLQSLEIENELRQAVKAFKVENLVKLSITFNSRYQCFAVFVDFFCQLKHLKEISFDGDAVFRFPKRDYKNIVQCKLRKIDITFSRKLENNNFMKFLETQAAEVEEMKLIVRLDEEEFDCIFMKFTKLKILTLSSNDYFNFLSNDHPEWELRSLKYYKHANGSSINLVSLMRRFPNLETFAGNFFLSVDLENYGQNSSNLKIEGINKLINGQFLSIHLSSIDVVVLDLHELKNAMFPNLKYLKARSVIGLDEDILKDFTANLKIIEDINLKNFYMSNIGALPSYISFIFKHMVDIKTIKTVKLCFGHESLNIDLLQKSVKFSWSKSCNDAWYKEILKNFKGFKLLDCDNQETFIE